MEAITDVQNGLACAYNLFESTADPALTEAAIYRIRALQAHYDYLIRSVKALDRAGVPVAAAAEERAIAPREVKVWG